MKQPVCIVLSLGVLSSLIGCNQLKQAEPIPIVQQQPEPEPLPDVPLIDPAFVEVTLPMEPTETEPIALAAAMDRSEVNAGDSVLLVIRMKVDPAWHSYAVSGPTGVAMPTKLELILPKGVTTKSDWFYPEPEMMDSIEGTIAAYVGDLRFAIPLSVSEIVAKGRTEVQCEIRYQACKHESCLPPDAKTLTASFEVR